MCPYFCSMFLTIGCLLEYFAKKHHKTVIAKNIIVISIFSAKGRKKRNVNAYDRLRWQLLHCYRGHCEYLIPFTVVEM